MHTYYLLYSFEQEKIIMASDHFMCKINLHQQHYNREGDKKLFIIKCVGIEKILLLLWQVSEETHLFKVVGHKIVPVLQHFQPFVLTLP